MFTWNEVDDFEARMKNVIPRKARYLKKPSNQLLNEECGMVKFWIAKKAGKFLYV